MSPPGTYFVTFSTWQRRRLFVVERYARLDLKRMYVYRRQGKFQLHTFVLMPEHVHGLLTPREGGTLGRGGRLGGDGDSDHERRGWRRQQGAGRSGFCRHRDWDREV